MMNICAAVLFLGYLFFLTRFKELPLIYFTSYILMSLFAVFIYYYDKRAAIKNKKRIREIKLHLISVLGGWPGALIAQRLFSHKSKKLNFQFIFFFSIAVNIFIFALASGLITKYQ